MGALRLQEEEILAEKVHSLDFAETGNFLRASSN